VSYEEEEDTCTRTRTFGSSAPLSRLSTSPVCPLGSGLVGLVSYLGSLVPYSVSFINISRLSALICV